jgi:Flp pilus assembly pilin Flp
MTERAEFHEMSVSMLTRLIAEEDGQDLLEYALLTAAIGMAAVAAFSLWGGAINATYGSWNTSVNCLWDPAAKC